jgi:hypothetical protein
VADAPAGWDKSLGDEVMKGSTLTRNIAQRFLWVTADRVQLTLLKFQTALRARDEWQAPAGILATLVATLAAAQFQQALGLPPHVWQGLFLLAALACVIWLGRALVCAWRTRNVTIDTVIEELWRESDPLRRLPAKFGGGAPPSPISRVRRRVDHWGEEGHPPPPNFARRAASRFISSIGSSAASTCSGSGSCACSRSAFTSTPRRAR